MRERISHGKEGQPKNTEAFHQRGGSVLPRLRPNLTKTESKFGLLEQIKSHKRNLVTFKKYANSGRGKSLAQELMELRQAGHGTMMTLTSQRETHMTNMNSNI